VRSVCRVVAFVPDDLPGSRLLDRHRATCLTCQAADARRRVLLRELAELRDELLVTPEAVHLRVMARLGSQEGAGTPSRRIARLFRGAIAAGAIGAAAVLGGLARRRARAAG